MKNRVLKTRKPAALTLKIGCLSTIASTCGVLPTDCAAAPLVLSFGFGWTLVVLSFVGAGTFGSGTLISGSLLGALIGSIQAAVLSIDRPGIMILESGGL